MNFMRDTLPVARSRTPVASRAASFTLRVMTWNIYLGNDWPNVRRVLRDHPADVICLQEVPEEDHPWRTARPSRIARELNLPFNFAPLWLRHPKRVGNMTLVRDGHVGPARLLRTRGSEPYATWSRVRAGETTLIVVNVHLAPLRGPMPFAFPLTEPTRMREAAHLNRLIRRCRHPVIALGDFNTFRPAPGYRLAARGLIDCRHAVGGRHAGTRPTWGWPFVIDHILVTPHFRAVDYGVIVTPGSDHRPVTATIETFL